MRKIIVFLIVLFVYFSMFCSIQAVAIIDNSEEMPREWFGKKKIIDRLGEYTRVVIIHYLTAIDDPDKDNASDSYELTGVYWNLNKYPDGIPYIINPSGGVKQGLKEAEIVAEIKAALESWDWAVDLDDYAPPHEAIYKIELYNNYSKVDYKARASIRLPDYKNVITWGQARPGVVAYTVIWYISSSKEIVDADMVLNSYYKWGIADGNEGTNDLVGKFDIRNIIAHEAGHWTGLDDIYDSNYWAMTMYGYTRYGEEIKRSLEPGDIAGAQAIYSESRI